ncbi:MAG: Dabb family protein [Actinomycetota bacterium]|nr:Dabb family protein [Actinomycetota bacterium]
MFRHVAVFRWTAGTTDQQVQALHHALGHLPAAIPALRQYRTGPDAGLVNGNWDFAVVADFDDAEGWRVYTAHPAHQKVIVELIKPVLAERAAVQYEC